MRFQEEMHEVGFLVALLLQDPVESVPLPVEIPASGPGLPDKPVHHGLFRAPLPSPFPVNEPLELRALHELRRGLALKEPVETLPVERHPEIVEVCGLLLPVPGNIMEPLILRSGIPLELPTMADVGGEAALRDAGEVCTVQILEDVWSIWTDPHVSVEEECVAVGEVAQPVEFLVDGEVAQALYSLRAAVVIPPRTDPELRLVESDMEGPYSVRVFPCGLDAEVV